VARGTSESSTSSRGPKRAWRTIFSGRSSTAWDNALVRQSGLPLPPIAGTATPYAYQAWREALVEETNWV
jgi:hypothetical protein